MSPVYCDEPARDSALSYARQRAGYGRAEIQVLDENWNVVETITNARGFEADGVSLTGVTLTFRHKYRARARNVFGSVRAGRLRRQVRYG